MNTKISASEWLSTSCFLNSLLREFQDWQAMDLPERLQVQSGCRQGICLTLSKHPEFRKIWIPLQRYSVVGRHRYTLPVYGEDSRQQRASLDLMHMATIILGEESIVGINEAEQRQIFLQRLQDSREMIEESLRLRHQDIVDSFDADLTFREAEQLLIVGHSLHPTPKSRDEFTADDKSVYSPEMAGRFPLSWVAADPRYFHERRSEHFSRDWIQELVASDPSLRLHVPAGFRILPMHPWQAEKLKQHPALQNAIAAGQVQFLTSPGDDWYPTSSVRSLYRQHAPYMLKFSLTLKLTNSIRHLLVHEVERGVQVYDVLQSQHGQSLLQEQRSLHVICEPAYAMLVGENGEWMHESIVVCRENPIQRDEDPQPLVLATLTQEDPLGRGNLIVRNIEGLAMDRGLTMATAARIWFKTFCRVALEPLMVAQSNFGILLGAHQQNLLLTLKDHLPDQLFFRDCQGTGYAEWAFERLRDQVQSLDLENGNIVSHDMAVYLFTYYLVINSTFNVIAAIADSEVIEETELLRELRVLVQELIDRQPFDNELLQDLLQEGTLMHKGNFRCSVQSINENTSHNPMSIYTPIRNPLHEMQA